MALLLFELARRLVAASARAAADRDRRLALLAAARLLPLGRGQGAGRWRRCCRWRRCSPAARPRADWPRRAWVPLGITIAAIIVVLGPGGALWAVPTLIPAWSSSSRRYGAVGALRLAAPVAVLRSAPAPAGDLHPDRDLRPAQRRRHRRGRDRQPDRPAQPLQVAGIWPSLDFRDRPAPRSRSSRCSRSSAWLHRARAPSCRGRRCLASGRRSRSSATSPAAPSAPR